MAYFARIAELRREGRDIISLATGELDNDTPERVAKAGKLAIDNGHTRYTMNNGTPELREVIAKHYSKQHGVTYTPDQVVVTNGAKQAIYNLLFSLGERGQEIVVIAPYYPSYPQQVTMIGARPAIVPTRAENNYQVDPDRLRAAITDHTSVIIINTPNNPTGCVYNQASLDAIAEVALEHNCWIIADDIYEAITYAPAEHVNILQHRPDLADRVVTVSGLSKSYAMTGWRIGYALGPASIIEAAALVQSHTTNNACSISQHAALAAISHKSDFPEKIAAELLPRRDTALDALRMIDGVTCPRADGAFYLFPDFAPAIDAAGNSKIQTTEQLALHLIEHHSVALIPGEAFGAPGRLRLSYATDTRKLEKGLQRLREAMELFGR